MMTPAIFRRVRIILLTFLAGVSLFRPSCGSEPEKSRPFYMGFTPFPWDMSEEAVAATNQFLARNGDLVAHHFDGGVPWTEALEDRPFHPRYEEDWKKRKGAFAGLKTLVSVTPLNGGRNALALYRGRDENLALPAPFKGKAFDDPLIKRAYLNYCRRAVEFFHPDYLAIGIEVNELLHHSPREWPRFLELHKSTYAELKKEYPSLPIFATITLHNLLNPGWKDMKLQQEKLRELLPYCDVVGVSYYPFMAGHSEKPTAQLDWIRAFSSKPLAITETGYPAETIRVKSLRLTIPSDPARQAAYFETLLDRATRDRYLFVVAFLHRDYDPLWEKIKATAPEAFIVWKDCGLLDEQGNARPACAVWKQYFARKHVAEP